MSSRANYFKLGLFVLCGLVAIVAGVVVFGVGALMQEGEMMETYIDESVQGLEVGSPVKYRGVRVGAVEKISFVNEYYGELSDEAQLNIGHYVLVLFRLDPKQSVRMTSSYYSEKFETLKDQGLRVRLTQQGITGIAYLEVDHLDPERYPPLPITWQPRHPYLPSAPSAITRISKSFDDVMQRVETLDIESIAVNLEEFLATMNQQASEAQVGRLSNKVAELLDEMKLTSQTFNTLLASPELESIPGDAAATVAASRRTVETIESETEKLFGDLNAMSTRMNELTETLDAKFTGEQIDVPLADLSATLANLRQASDVLPETALRLNNSLGRIDDLIAVQQSNVETILDNVREISESIRALSREAQRYPSHVIFGDAPAPPTATQGGRNR